MPDWMLDMLAVDAELSINASSNLRESEPEEEDEEEESIEQLRHKN